MNSVTNITRLTEKRSHNKKQHELNKRRALNREKTEANKTKEKNFIRRRC